MPGKTRLLTALSDGILLTVVLSTISPPTMALGPKSAMDASSTVRSSQDVVNSDQLLDLGTSDSSALRLEGEQSMRVNNIDRAIVVLQKSVQLAPNDMDGRILYAEALEKKLVKQKERDPGLYNFVVKQWLYISKKAAFMDQANQGVTHLASLTGHKPGKWESSGRYLSRVLMPDDKSAQVAYHAKPGDKPQ